MSLDFLLSIVRVLLSFSECDNKIRGGDKVRGPLFSMRLVSTPKPSCVCHRHQGKGVGGWSADPDAESAHS